MDDFIKCPECGDWFNPAWLNEVAFHMHSGIIIDQTIKGERVMKKEKLFDIQPAEKIANAMINGFYQTVCKSHDYVKVTLTAIGMGKPIITYQCKHCGKLKKAV